MPRTQLDEMSPSCFLIYYFTSWTIVSGRAAAQASSQHQRCRLIETNDVLLLRSGERRQGRAGPSEQMEQNQRRSLAERGGEGPHYLARDDGFSVGPSFYHCVGGTPLRGSFNQGVLSCLVSLVRILKRKLSFPDCVGHAHVICQLSMLHGLLLKQLVVLFLLHNVFARPEEEQRWQEVMLIQSQKHVKQSSLPLCRLTGR